MYSVIISQHLDRAFIYNVSSQHRSGSGLYYRTILAVFVAKAEFLTALRTMDPLKKKCKHILSTGQALLCLTNVKLLPKCLTEEQIWGMLSSNVVVTLDVKFLQFILFFLFLFLHLCFWMQKTFCVHYIWHVTLSNHKTLTSLLHCYCRCCCITFFIPWCFSSSFICYSLDQFESSISFSLLPNESIFIVQVSLYLTLISHYTASPKQEVDRTNSFSHQHRWTYRIHVHVLNFQEWGIDTKTF